MQIQFPTVRTECSQKLSVPLLDTALPEAAALREVSALRKTGYRWHGMYFSGKKIFWASYSFSSSLSAAMILSLNSRLLRSVFSTTSSSPWLSSTISSQRSSAKSIIWVEKMVMQSCFSERSSCFISSATTTSRDVKGSSSNRIFGWAMMLMSICILFFIPWE